MMIQMKRGAGLALSWWCCFSQALMATASDSKHGGSEVYSLNR
jgi:hypothetical protein